MGQGRQGGGSCQPADVGQGPAWLPCFLHSHLGQHVTSLSFVSPVSSMEMVAPVLYSS